MFAKYQFLFLLFSLGVLPTNFRIKSPTVCTTQTAQHLKQLAWINFASYILELERQKLYQRVLLQWSLNTWQNALDKHLANLILIHVNELSHFIYNKETIHYQRRLLWLLTKPKVAWSPVPNVHLNLRCFPFFDKDSPPPINCDFSQRDAMNTSEIDIDTGGNKMRGNSISESTDLKNQFTCEKWFVNLSSKTLSTDAINLLQLGFKYALSNTNFDPTKFVQPIETSLMMIDNEVERSIKRSVITNLVNKFHKKGDNTPFHKASRIIKGIRKDKSVVLLNADKGNISVLMDRSDYDRKMLEYLSNEHMFEMVDKDPTNNVKQKLNLALTSMRDKQLIPLDMYKKCIPRADSKAPTLFSQVKLHKNETPLRPIVNARFSPTQNLAKVLTTILKGFNNCCIYSLRNTDDFHGKIINLQVQKSDKLASFDVKNMFNSIPHDMIFNAISYFVEKFDLRFTIGVETLRTLINLVLMNSYCRYNRKFYFQKHGLAMGSSLSPIIADIVMAYFECKHVMTQSHKPKVWWRYVDDVFLIWPSTFRQLELFQKNLNKAEPGIEFTAEYNQEGDSINYLELTVQKHNNGLKTKIYRKNTFSARYLHNTSAHPKQVKLGIAINMFRKAIKYTTCSDDLKSELTNIEEILDLNGFSAKWIKNAKMIAKRRCKDDLTVKNEFNDKNKIVVLEYIPNLSNQIGSILRNIGKIPVYRSTNTIANMYYCVEKRPDDILDTVGCVYLIRCECQSFYIGETKRRLKVRISEHQRYTKEKYKLDPDLKFHSAVAYHAAKENHKIIWEHTKVLCYESNDFMRKLKESYCIALLKPNINLNTGMYIPNQWFYVIKRFLAITDVDI